MPAIAFIAVITSLAAPADAAMPLPITPRFSLRAGMVCGKAGAGGR